MIGGLLDRSLTVCAVGVESDADLVVDGARLYPTRRAPFLTPVDAARLRDLVGED
ncbi:MAG: hypothetical protein R2695_06735 [Acidimicrobiales bacterium]